MTHASVHIQIAPEAAPTTPCWFAEVAIVAQILKTYGLVDLIEMKVRFARARFDHYDLIDFVAVLIGYALSGEPSLQAFYARLAPFSEVFMALFERSRLPHRSTHELRNEIQRSKQTLRDRGISIKRQREKGETQRRAWIEKRSKLRRNGMRACNIPCLSTTRDAKLQIALHR